MLTVTSSEVKSRVTLSVLSIGRMPPIIRSARYMCGWNVWIVHNLQSNFCREGIGCGNRANIWTAVAFRNRNRRSLRLNMFQAISGGGIRHITMEETSMPNTCN